MEHASVRGRGTAALRPGSLMAKGAAGFLGKLALLLRGWLLGGPSAFGSVGPVRGMGNGVAGCVGCFWRQLFQSFLGRTARRPARKRQRLSLQAGRPAGLAPILGVAFLVAAWH
eukprot:8276437-Prorocentrum_lima.AAC.1